MGGSYIYDSTKELEIQFQVGSKLMPLYPMRSQAETFAQLKNVWVFIILIFILLISHKENIAKPNLLLV